MGIKSVAQYTQQEQIRERIESCTLSVFIISPLNHSFCLTYSFILIHLLLGYGVLKRLEQKYPIRQTGVFFKLV